MYSNMRYSDMLQMSRGIRREQTLISRHHDWEVRSSNHSLRGEEVVIRLPFWATVERSDR